MKHLYPIITTPVVRECRDFYVNALGGKVLFQKDWYVHLSLDGFEIGFLHPEPPVRLPVFQHATTSRGLCIALEVEDVQELYQDLRQKNIEILARLHEYPSGELAFSVMDPSGVVLNIVERHSDEGDMLEV